MQSRSKAPKRQFTCKQLQRVVIYENSDPQHTVAIRTVLLVAVLLELVLAAPPSPHVSLL